MTDYRPSEDRAVVLDWLSQTGIPVDRIYEIRITPDSLHGLPKPMMEIVYAATDPDGDMFTTGDAAPGKKDVAVNRMWVPIPPLLASE